MHFGHFLFLVCYVCCRTYAASLEEAEPQDVQENSFNDTTTKQDLPDTNITQIMPDVHDKGGTIGSELPGDYYTANTTDGLGNGNESSIDSGGKITNDTPIKAEEPVGIPYTERSAGRRLGSSRYKSGRQQVSIGDLTISDHVPRHGALLHMNDKIDTLAVREDTAMASNTGENNVKRKRRIPSSSATPSIQIVILVVGAVVGCLLLTGFVRWRVRGKLNAQKKAKMSEDFIYEGGRVYKGSSEMTTIYECECEESQSMLRLGESLDVDMDDFQEDGTKFGEISCSQRFDMPLSGMSRAYQSRHSVLQSQARSPKSGRHFRLVPGSKRSSMNRHKYGHKNRYSKHLKRRLENMFVQTLETIPMESSAQANEHGDSFGCSAYFSEHGNKHGIRNVSNENLAPTLLQQPNPIKHGSPTFRRGAFASILNTWRSLSFNRDWVGKMWQEQHNIRRLSDILRGRRESLSSSKGSTKDSDAQSSQLSSSTESVSSSSSFASLFARRKNSNTDTDAALTAFFGKNVALEKVYEENGRSFVKANTSATTASKETELAGNNTRDASFNADTPIPARDYRDIPTNDTFLSCRSFCDLHEEQAEHESLLSNSLQSCNIPARQFSEHPRYQRIHQRKRSDSKKRSNSFNGSSSRSPVRLNHFANTSRHDDFSQSLGNGSRVLVHADLDTPDTHVPNISTAHLQPDHADQHSVASTSAGNESNSDVVSPTFSSSVSQKRGVADQHSKGAETVFTTRPPRTADHSDSKKPYLE